MREKDREKEMADNYTTSTKVLFVYTLEQGWPTCGLLHDLEWRTKPQ